MTLKQLRDGLRRLRDYAGDHEDDDALTVAEFFLHYIEANSYEFEELFDGNDDPGELFDDTNPQ